MDKSPQEVEKKREDTKKTMKELHLICNAHLDPVWQWDWNEGATAALATFYSAVELADEYDYIFCHNEALLYEYVEAFDPTLFKRIQQLVKRGKWHIMGGWYVQPDCNVPSGEGFVRQIETGLSYFKEKFDYRPTVALNFDSFGHTQGLVQILKKCGFNGYLFCRPMKRDIELPAMHFNWIGLDGSAIKAVRCEDETIYCSMLGQAAQDIKRKMQPWLNEEVGVALWGVGNHGGGASRKDLSDILKFQKEMEKEGIRVLHSTPESFIDAIQPKVDLDQALQPVFVKCYSSDSRIKQKHAVLENKLLITEKICAIAAWELQIDYPTQLLKEAQKKLSAIQFHDILSGTSIRAGEESSLRIVDYALELVDKAFTKAFMALMNEYKQAKGETYPLFVYNPHPYSYDGVVEGEIFMLNPIISETEGYEFEIKKDGKPVEFQLVKEDSNINFDRRKRFAIRSTLVPLGLTRFDVEYKKGKKNVVDRTPQYFFKNGENCVGFDKITGCLNDYEIKGKRFLCGNAFIPIMFDDNEDPWGWHMKTVGKNYQAFQPKIANRIVERGAVYTKIENVYQLNQSEIYIWYKIYTDKSYIDVDMSVVWNEDCKGLKLAFPFASKGAFIGQTSFGTQIYTEEQEQCAQKFCGIDDGENVVGIAANYLGGCAMENGVLYVTLFNGSVYCAHPVDDLPIVDENRFQDYLEKGRHSFRFRLFVAERRELEKNALEFTQTPYVLNAYPHGKGRVNREPIVWLSNDCIVLSSLRKVGEKTWSIRLVNNQPQATNCSCTAFDKSLDLSFGKYEVKTLHYNDGVLTESNSMLFFEE